MNKSDYARNLTILAGIAIVLFSARLAHLILLWVKIPEWSNCNFDPAVLIVSSCKAYLNFRFGYWLSKKNRQIDFSGMQRRLRFKEVAKLADELVAGIKKVILIIPI